MSVNAPLRDYLMSRRSVTLPFLGAPGPSEGELRDMLTIAARVPDHGKLAPWRMITYQDEARVLAGQRLAELMLTRDADADPQALEIERKRFLPAPLTVGVLAAPREHPKIPEFEQLLSAGCVAFNLVHAANAFGYGAHWVTRWYAFDKEAAALLGARAGERFVGFVHIGTPERRLEERDRPALLDVVSAYPG